MRLPAVVQNGWSYLGAAIGLLALVVFVFLFVFHVVAGAGGAPYAGLVLLLVLPAVFGLGLLLIAVGAVLEWRRLRRPGARAGLRFPVIDLNNSRHRTAFFALAVASLLVLFMVVFGGYQAYEVTDSVAFCGTVCHTVMKPEYTAYRQSPHARVACVDCHVGPGADWYLRSKLSGLRQVYAVLSDSYPRPISTPIEDLRPAQDTCEKCHWPGQFFGGQQKRLVYFLADEANTRWEIDLLIRTGGGGPDTGRMSGIHWHMNVANRVEYFARDEQRRDIPWVRTTNLSTGEVTEYVSSAQPPSPGEIARAPVRTMDCMDCHNRPSHIFHSPSDAVNLALATGRIDPALPFVKKRAVELLTADYPSEADALAAIEAGLSSFYRQHYAELAESRQEAIARAGRELQGIYRQNFFPEMKTRWDVYPDHTGHLDFAGCFRCHDGEHRSPDGRVLGKDCNSCHVIMLQGTPGSFASAMEPQGLRFQHPVEMGDVWESVACNTCHTGATP